MITALAADEPEPLATGGIIPAYAVLVPELGSGCWWPTLTPERSAALTQSQPWLRQGREITVSLGSMVIHPKEQAA